METSYFLGNLQDPVGRIHSDELDFLQLFPFRRANCLDSLRRQTTAAGNSGGIQWEDLQEASNPYINIYITIYYVTLYYIMLLYIHFFHGKRPGRCSRNQSLESIALPSMGQSSSSICSMNWCLTHHHVHHDSPVGGLEPWNFMIFHSVGNFIIPFDELHHFSEG